MNRLYRALLRLYPAGFREEYSSALERQLADEYRDSGGGPRFWLRVLRDLAITIPAEAGREMRQDLRYALRVYRQRSLVTILALAALSMGIGATTGVFSVLNALLLRSLPFREPDRLVQLVVPKVNALSGRGAFYRWASASPYAESVATYSVHEMNLGLTGGTARVKVAEASANFFRTMGARMSIGRGFAPEEDGKGKDRVAVIGYGLWQELFGGDPGVLGRTVRVNGTTLHVAGVAPPRFDFPGRTALWTASVFNFDTLPKGGVSFWETVARLKPGLPLARARSMFETETGPRQPARPGSIEPALVPLRDRLAGPVRQASWVLMGVAAFVLLIACANVAHLLLSRVSDRRPELAIRAALGASLARLVQQLVTESMLLTTVATAVGLAVAAWASRLAAMAQPAQLEAQSYEILDWQVFAFAIGLAAAIGLFFGVAPAFLMGRLQPSGETVRSQAGSRRSGVARMRSALVAAQAALTLVLLAGSFLLGRTFLRLLDTDLGFRTGGLVTMSVSLSGSRYEADGLAGGYYRQALERLRAVPGVESAGGAPYLPLLDQAYMGMEYSLDPAHKVPMSFTMAATPDYFRTMGTSMVEGREFRDGEASGSVIVNEAFVRQLGAGPSLTGKQIWDYRRRAQYTVVGVARDMLLRGPASKPWPQVYFPVERFSSGFITFVARVRGDARQMLAACRDAVRLADPQIAVYDVKTLDQRLADNLARPRFYTTAIVFFGSFAMLLAVIGIYGVASYSIAQRKHEIGVRMAIGAGPSRLRRMLLWENLAPLGAGLAAGIAGAYALKHSLERLVYSAPPLEAGTVLGAAVVLSVAAAAAVWIAGRRVLRMDPTAALRLE